MKQLNEIAYYAAGRTPSRANTDFWNPPTGGTPWVSIADMKNYGTLTESKETITEAAFRQVFHNRLVPSGTLLMSFKLTIGRVATLGIDACHNEAIIAIYPKPGTDQRYLGYYLSQVDYSALQDRQVKGQTLNQDKINRIAVACPPVEEQSAIADVLDEVRKAIGQQGVLLDLLEKTKRALMRDLFMFGLQGEAQKDSEIGRIPESWDVRCFESVREWLQYGTSIQCDSKRSTYPVLRIPNVEAAFVNVGDLKYCDLPKAVAEKYQLLNGDLLFIRTNGVRDRLGKCAVYSGDPPNALFASYLIRARLLPDQVVPRYVAYFFSSELGTELVAGGATPAADGKFNLNTGAIDSILLPVPPTLVEQQDIVGTLEAMDQKIDLHGRKTVVLEELFQSLLYKLMTGEVRVSDLELSVLEVEPEVEVTV